MSLKYSLLAIGIAMAVGAPARALAQAAATAPTDGGKQQRYVVRTGTATFRFAENLREVLGFGFVAHGHLEEGSASSAATFSILGSSSLELQARNGRYSGMVGGGIRTRGALLLDKPGERVVIGNPAIEADPNGVLTVISTLNKEDVTASALLSLQSVMIDMRAAEGELRLVGELAVTRSWAVELGYPKAAGAIVGTVTVKAGLETADDAAATAVTYPDGGTSEDTGRAPAGVSDVEVVPLQSVYSYGSVNGISAFAVGTTACNKGTAHTSWFAWNNQHPVIVQNAYRLKDDRFEQIGMSWLKHGFFAVSGSFCTPCENDPTDGTQLGVGCSDPYSATLNGIQTNMSPRSTINADTGYFPYDGPTPAAETLIDRRLQINNADLDPLFNAEARYFVQGHYVLPDDAAARTHNNNASYREVFLDMPQPGVYRLEPDAAVLTQQGQPAVRAWQDEDGDVEEVDLQVTGEGLFILAAKASETPAGVFRYSYALQNLNSDQSGGSFSVPIPEGALVANIGFHDVDYHSGDPYDRTDWQAVVADGSITWSVVACEPVDNANALRFGTVYSFYFESDIRSAPTTITVGLFKTGPAYPYSEITGTSVGPKMLLNDCNDNFLPDDCDIDCGEPEGLCDVTGCGDSGDCNDNAIPDECEPDCNNNDAADECDIDPTDPDGNGMVSADCQANGIPDECELDCDGDGHPDDCVDPPDDDVDGVNNCYDLCLDEPRTVKCACPEYMDCCWPGLGYCLSTYNLPLLTAEQCEGDSGVPGCIPVPCHDGCRIGDYDMNGTLDAFDIAALQLCIGGDGSNQECVFAFDGTGDGLVTLEDYITTIHGYLTGPTVE